MGDYGAIVSIGDPGSVYKFLIEILFFYYLHLLCYFLVSSLQRNKSAKARCVSSSDDTMTAVDVIFLLFLLSSQRFENSFTPFHPLFFSNLKLNFQN